MSTVLSDIRAAGVITAKACGSIDEKTDTLGKFVKVVIPVLDIAKTVFSLVPGYAGLCTGLDLLRGQLNTAKSVINATNILERGWEWSDHKARAAVLSSWKKTANRVTLTAAQVLETVGFVDKLSYGFFSQASMTLAHIPVIDMVKNTLYMASATFGIWYAAPELIKARKGIAEGSQSRKKWKQLQMELGSAEQFQSKKVAAKYQAKIDQAEKCCKGADGARIARWKEYVAALEKDASQENYRERVTKFQELKKDRLLEKYESSLNNLGTTSAEQQDKVAELGKAIKDEQTHLADAGKRQAAKIRKSLKETQSELTAAKAELAMIKKLETYKKAIVSGDIAKLADHKVEKYSTRVANSKKLQTKSWISIAVDVGKIVMISLGMLAMALNPILPFLSGTAASLVLCGMSAVSNALGLTKNLYADIAPKPVKEPVFSYA